MTTNGIKTHENFRLVLISRLDKDTITDENLILLTRPLQLVPSADFEGILDVAYKAMDLEHYENHCKLNSNN